MGSTSKSRFCDPSGLLNAYTDTDTTNTPKFMCASGVVWGLIWFTFWSVVYSPVIIIRVKNFSFHKARPPSVIESSHVRAHKSLKVQSPKGIARIKQEETTATAIRKAGVKVTLPSHP